MNFPRTVFVGKLTLLQQTDKIRSEVKELKRELRKKDVDYFAAAIETMDIMQAADTQLKNLAEQHGVNLAEAENAFIQKNRVRGYYA